MKTAMARCLMRRVQRAGEYDPKVLPDEIRGLGKYWDRIQGLDSAAYADIVEKHGYVALPEPSDRPRDIATVSASMTPSSVTDVRVVDAGESKTVDETLEELCAVVQSQLCPKVGAVVTLQVPRTPTFKLVQSVPKFERLCKLVQEICERMNKMSTPVVWAAIGGPVDPRNMTTTRWASDRIMPAFNKAGRHQIVAGVKGHRAAKAPPGATARHVQNCTLARLHNAEEI